MKKYIWFTLVEVLIVIIIAGILLGIMMNLWWNYLKRLNYQQDREIYISAINEFIMRWRTTSYYQNVKYTYFDVQLKTGSIMIYYGTGEADSTLCNTGVLVKHISFAKSTLSGISLSLPYTFRIEPYKLGCSTYCSASGGMLTGIVVSKSIISDDQACFLFDGNLCKFTQSSCP